MFRHIPHIGARQVMAAREKIFCFSDAWIFASLGPSIPPKEGVLLTDLVARADMLNHAIPNFEEVTSAAAILFRNGLIDFGVNGMTRTEHGQFVAENGFARRGGLFSIVTNVQAALNSNRIKHPQIETIPDLTWLTRPSYSAACRKYSQAMKKILADLAKKSKPRAV